MSVAITSFTVFAISQIGTPGPANMAMLSAGAKFGFRSALPFMSGVVLGKQLIIWPLGYGLMNLATSAPAVFEAAKWAAALYIIWLAWKIAGLKLAPSSTRERPFSFWLGLAVHPLNPKAWAMIAAGFTAFTSTGTPVFQATATIAAILLVCQLVLHPVWTFAGSWIADHIAGSPIEPYLMRILALVTVLSVLFVLFGGGSTA